jgi:glycosyltransferase involved in cell wall biosynthesis
MPGRSRRDRRPRAVVIGPSWPPGRPPSRLAQALRAEGWNVSVRSNPDLDEPVRRPRLAAWLLAAAWRSSGQLVSAFRATRHVSGFRNRLWVLYRVLPVLARPHDAAFVAARPEAEPYAALAAASRLVAVTESPLPHPDRREPRLGRLLGNAAEVWCATETEREAAAAHGARDPTLRVAAVSSVSLRRRSARTGRLVCTAPLDWSAGQTYALAALRRLVDRGLDLGLALGGEGPDRERILFTVEDLGLAGRVDVGGATLEEADVFVLPAVYDGAWPEAWEAAATGVPVVASSLPGLAGLDAVFVPPRDPGRLAEALARLVGR